MTNTEPLPSSTPSSEPISERRFSRAYRRGFESTVRFLRSRGVSEDRAEEFAQAAWSKGWERRRQLRDAKQVVAWINTIAFNLFRNQCRRPQHDELPLHLAAPRTKHQARLDVDRLLSKCSPRDRETLEKYYIDGYDSREIAKQTGASSGAVRIRLMRARRRLKEVAKGCRERS